MYLTVSKPSLFACFCGQVVKVMDPRVVGLSPMAAQLQIHTNIVDCATRCRKCMCILPREMIVQQEGVHKPGQLCA